METQPILRPDLLAACQLLAPARARRAGESRDPRRPKLVGILAELAEAGGRA